MKILIVEDEQRARQGLRDVILSLPGKYEIVGETSYGQNALEMIPLLKPDVVFTDIKMPFMSGLDLIRAARAQNLNVDFVIVTAFADFDFAQQAVSLGVVEYLLKPVNVEDVERVLERIQKNALQRSSFGWKQSGCLREQYPEAHPLILKVLDIIENSYGGKISQKNLAGSLGVSPEYLSYLFKKNMGQNFAKFLQSYRIDKAKYLLKQGENPAEVPFMVGFSDAKYFHKVFRETVGMGVNEFVHER